MPLHQLVINYKSHVLEDHKGRTNFGGSLTHRISTEREKRFMRLWKNKYTAICDLTDRCS